MKLIKTTTVAVMLALTGIGMASATTTTIHVTGSTAFRGSAVEAICNVLHAQGGSGVVTAAYDVTSLSKANAEVIYGPVVSGNQTIVNCAWSGSVGGLQTLTGAIPIATFIDPTTYASSATAVTLGGGSTGASGGLGIGSGYTAETAIKPDLAFTDVFKKSTPYNLASLTENTVGIIPFKFVANKGSSTNLTNMTPQLAQYLYKSGTCPLALFTGLNSDETTLVYALGRDNDSGTRLTAFAETGVGVTTAVAQYFPYDSTTSGYTGTDTVGVIGLSGTTSTTINAVNLVPDETVNGTDLPLGTGGYSSGGNLANAMKATNSLANSAFVTYLSFGDAGTAILGGAQEMKYNGVTFSTTAIQEGQYTFWGYEHLDNLTSASTTVKSFVTSVKSQLNSGDDLNSGAGISFNSMQVQRTSDGSSVFNKY